MEKELIDFLNENQHLVNENRWEDLYQKCASSIISQLTDCLLTAEINPFDYLKRIPAKSFYRSKIVEFTIPDNIITIEDSAFRDCDSLTSIVIPDSVTTIGDGAFYWCDSLTEVIIPDSVTSIGESAFQNCKNLEIKYSGTKAQWKDLAKGKFANATYICTCSDGIVKKSR